MTETKPTTDDRGAAVVQRGKLIVLGVILALLTWYLLADRYTPSTTQARVQGYVVGVAPKVAGLVTEVWAGNNRRVQAGDELFQIDTSQYQIALEKAQSDLETAYRQFDAGDAAVQAARASLRSAEANRTKARQDATRLQKLREEDPGTVSERRLDVAVATLESAEARVVAAEATVRQAIEQMGGDDDETNARLKSALAAVDKARLDLENTTVVASIDGVVTDLRVDVGAFAGTGSPVLTLISTHDVWISAEFTENNLGRLREGSPVEIVFDARPGRVFGGQVRSIGLGVGSGTVTPPGVLPTIQNDRDWLRQAQRFPVIVEFDPDQGPELRSALRIGGQATVIAYAGGAGPLKWLGQLYIRVASLLTYAY